MFYLDTSVLVSALTQEAASTAIHDWLDLQDSRELAISEWVCTELSAALSIKIRTKQIGPAQRSDALAAFADMKAATLRLYPISANEFQQATRFADYYAFGLRAGDALHLAIASTNRAVLVTRDRKLAEAAQLLGVVSILL